LLLWDVNPIISDNFSYFALKPLLWFNSVAIGCFMWNKFLMSEVWTLAAGVVSFPMVTLLELSFWYYFQHTQLSFGRGHRFFSFLFACSQFICTSSFCFMFSRGAFHRKLFFAWVDLWLLLCMSNLLASCRSPQFVSFRRDTFIMANYFVPQLFS